MALSTTWIAAALWTTSGVLKYDINKPDLLAGGLCWKIVNSNSGIDLYISLVAPWKEGWILWRTGMFSASDYKLFWAKLNNCTLALLVLISFSWSILHTPPLIVSLVTSYLPNPSQPFTSNWRVLVASDGKPKSMHSDPTRSVSSEHRRFTSPPGVCPMPKKRFI